MIGIQNMHDVQLREIDLNLLVVLDALLETRSVTAAAHRVGLSQSATSHALSRLRVALDDALLVRGAGGLVRTLRAEQMMVPLRSALTAAAAAIARPRPFDAARAVRRFTLTTADYVEYVLLPPLMRRLSAEAPGVDISVPPGRGDVADALLRGEFDLALGPDIAANDRPGIHARRLFDDRFVCMLRRDHPALDTRLTAARFAALRHAFIAPRGKHGGAVDDALAALGLSRRVVLMVPSFLAAPFVVAQTDLVLTLPERVARAFADTLPLAIVAPPIEIVGFSMMLLWHDRVHDDPAHRWLRQVIVEVAEQVAPPPDADRPSARRGKPKRR